MKFGYCMPLGSKELSLSGLWKLLRDNGFDYLECSAGQLLSLNSDNIEEVHNLHKNDGFTLRSVNCFVPGDMKLCGAERRSDGELRNYVNRVFTRMNELNAGIIVFGSGSARTIPQGTSPDEGKAQLDEFLRICADEGEKHSVTVVIEPLNRSETNIYTSLAESAEAVNRIGSHNVRLLADSFHMSKEGESADPGEYTPLLAHAHIAEAGSRHYPGSEGGKYVVEFLTALENRGYNGGVSIECVSGEPLADLVRTAEFLHRHNFIRN